METAIPVDLGALAEWGDAAAMALSRVLQHGLAPLLAAHGAVVHDAAQYAPRLGVVAVHRIQSDLARLAELLHLVGRFRGTGVWLVAAGHARRSAAAVAQLVQIDTAALHATLTLPPDEDEALQCRIASAFSMHQSQYADLRDDCFRMLVAFVDGDGAEEESAVEAVEEERGAEAMRARVLGERPPRTFALRDESPMLQRILANHRNPLLEQLGSLTVASERLTEPQRALLNDEFVDGVVGFLHLHRRLLARFSAFKSDQAQQQRMLRSREALTRIRAELEGLPQLCTAAATRAIDVALTCEIVTDCVGTIVTWAGSEASAAPASAPASAPPPATKGAMALVSSDVLHRHVGPHNSAVCHQHVVRHLLLLPRFTQELLERARVAHRALRELQATCESLTAAISEAVDTHAATLFALAQGIAGVLRDGRAVDDTLREQLPQLTAMAVPPSEASEPEAVARWWCDDPDGKVFTDGSSIKVGALVARLRLVATVVTTVRHAVSQTPASVDALTQTASRLREEVDVEAQRTQRVLDETGEALRALRSADQKAEFDSGRTYTTAAVLTEAVTATMLRHGGGAKGASPPISSPSTRAPMKRQSDRTIAGHLLIDLCREYSRAEGLLTAVAHEATPGSGDLQLVECERSVGALATVAELLGHALFLDSEAMRQIGAV